MSVFLDGLTVLRNNWDIFIFVFACQLLIVIVLRSVFGNDLSISEYISLGIAGWLVPATLLSLIWIRLGLQYISWIGIPFLILLILLSRLKPDRRPASTATILIFALAVLASILLRLIYISKTIFPPYFDSAQHYAMIKSIMGNNAAGSSYYHLGFHFLTAFLASAFHTEVTQVMLLLGQVFLAFIPFSLFFPVMHETRSNPAGWFAVILSAFGWYMPAHAVDWGKYPALMSLGMMPFVFGLSLLLSRSKDKPPVKNRWVLYGLLGVSILLSVFAHSRSLIVFGIVFLAWIMATWCQELPRRQMNFIFISIIIVTILEIIHVERQAVLVLLFDPYLHKGILITLLVLALAIFAWTSYPRLTFVCTLTITFLLASLFIPVTWIPGYGDLTLLDRPFLEMALFLPLSLLGGLGLAGLEKKLQGSFSWGRYAGLLVIGIVAVNAFFAYDLYPSSCCVIVGNDDLAAMDWMENQLPVEARIGISSTELKVIPSESFEGVVGGDAGIWVTPLTGMSTITLPYNLEFDQQPALDMLCQNGVSHLFVGEVGQTFDNAKLNSRPEWYRPLLAMPVTRVYEVIGCGGL